MLYFEYPEINLEGKKIAGFDLDYTLIKPKSGKKFPIDENDWTWLYLNTKEKLIEIAKEYQVVIFSNQMGIDKGKTTKEEVETKCKNIQQDIGIPMIFLISDKDDKYRKPRVGLWKKLLKQGIEVDESFYVGDAAGRGKTEEYKKDHSDTDRKFAKNIKVEFYTPESFFLKEKERPWSYDGYQLNNSTEKLKYPKLSTKKKTFVLISGYPGSGKSYLAKKLEKKYGYHFLSKDKDKGKFNSNLKKILEQGESVIIEGLLYSDKQRKILLEYADEFNYKKILVKVNTTQDLSFHLNYYRYLYDDGKLVPKIVYNIYNKNYVEPNDEDYDKIHLYHPEIKDKVNKYFLY